ncbi:MBL fold metallo-hydrolase [Pyruvatibacter mobilis]|uniref:MBL fold metallo-hydrolase n=1 Tax=Pyruvatibacter mobilis TaxID=1712261 RepID=UPI003D0C1273
MDLIDRGVFSRKAQETKTCQVDLAGLEAGTHQTDDIIFALDEAGRVTWAIDRVCDHASGKLVLDAGGATATCPLHGWQLDLASRRYTNAQTGKHALDFTVEDGVLAYERTHFVLEAPARQTEMSPAPMTVRFLAHACVVIDVAGLRVVTDPWLMGPCFVTGWWHAVTPPEDALDVLNSADLVYISHNHPDHMHRETLEKLRRDMPIIAPDFSSGSTVGPLREMGFETVHAAQFNHVYEVGETGGRVSVLQAGDFRDDSGLWVEGGGHSALLSVDSNKLNNFVLPEAPDILLTAFAGGASGYPVTFDTMSDEEKRRVTARNRMAVRDMAERYVREARPRAVMPYAGFFTEAAPEDAGTKALNAKNSSADICEYLGRKMPEIVFADPLKTDIAVFDGDRIELSAFSGDRLFDVTPAYCQGYIARMVEEGRDHQGDALKSYFEAASFTDDLIVYVAPMTRDFSSYVAEGVVVDFTGDAPKVDVLTAQEVADRFAAERGESGPRRLLIRVRKDSLWHVVANGLPWEDLSIGFQCRVDRAPDVYNSDFWFHFTNVHIGEAVMPRLEAAQGNVQAAVDMG